MMTGYKTKSKDIKQRIVCTQNGLYMFALIFKCKPNALSQVNNCLPEPDLPFAKLEVMIAA